jgi:hypothetical protein
VDSIESDGAFSATVSAFSVMNALGIVPRTIFSIVVAKVDSSLLFVMLLGFIG